MIIAKDEQWELKVATFNNNNNILIEMSNIISVFKEEGKKNSMCRSHSMLRMAPSGH